MSGFGSNEPFRSMCLFPSKNSLFWFSSALLLGWRNGSCGFAFGTLTEPCAVPWKACEKFEKSMKPSPSRSSRRATAATSFLLASICRRLTWFSKSWYET